MKNLKGIRLVQHDLPENFEPGHSVGIDTEAMGLCGGRDRLCLVQISNGDGICYLIQVAPNPQPAPRLAQLLTNPSVEKIFHFARFDVGILYRTFAALCQPIYCTKIASRLARTYTERHGLKEICRELLGTEISKSEQSSDWGAETLTDNQKSYAASDVLYLHGLRRRLDDMLRRENRLELFKSVCRCLPARVLLDCSGFEYDIFAH
jgi:ribonuclease D